MPGLADDLHFRRLVFQVTDDHLTDRLDAPPITLYAGFDPTAPSLHVGSLLPLCTLRRFALAGHRPIALMGGATGLIGDPGGKSEERTLLTKATIEANIEGIRPQIEHFFPPSGAAGPAGSILNNASWFSVTPLLDFLRDTGKHFTVNQMIAKESVKARIDRPEQGISYTEFSYMLLQAHDFLHLHREHGCTLQIGGSDQWGNITMGVELVARVTGAHVVGLTMPLVTKADGTKFGKTESGTVWLDPERTSPYRLHQFFLQTDDAVVGDHLRWFTFLDHDEILELDEKTAAHPESRAAQATLASEVCTLIHGPAATANAERAAAALFGGDLHELDEPTLLDVFSEVPSTVWSRASIDGSGVDVIEAFTSTGLSSSKSDARRTVGGGGAYVNGRRIEEEGSTIGVDDLLCGRWVVLRKGRREMHLVRVE